MEGMNRLARSYMIMTLLKCIWADQSKEGGGGGGGASKTFHL